MDLLALSGLLLLVSFMVALGLEIRPGMMRAELAQPGRLVRGVVLDLVLVPLATAVCLWILGITGPVAAGVVLLSVAPGAPFSPSMAKKAGGGVAYMIVLAVLLGVVTAFTAAPSARWLLSYQGTAEVRPPVVLVKLALFQWLPLAAGAWAALKLAPRHVAILKKVTRVCLLLALVVLVLFALPHIGALLRIGWTGLLAVIVTMELAVIVAWLVGGEDRQLARTLAATVSVPNIGLALTIAKAAGVSDELLALLAALFVVRVLVNQGLVTWMGRRATSREPLTGTRTLS